MRTAALSLLFFTSISTVFAAGREIAPTRNRPQAAPSVATDGIDFLATWIESNSPPQTLTAARVTHSGAPLDATEVASATQYLFEQKIAFGGGIYLVVWNESGRIYARRLTASGVALDTTPITIATENAFAPALAWTGTAFLVAWSTGAGTDRGIFASVVDPNGNVSARKLVAQATDNNSLYPENLDVASDGRQAVVVWTDWYVLPCTCLPTPVAVEAIRVSTDGAPLDDGAVTVSRNATSANIASSGTEFGVTFQSGPDLFAVLLHADGPLRADAPIRLFTWFTALQSDIGWDGRSYVITWLYGPSSIRSWLATTHLTGGVVYASSFVNAAGPKEGISPVIASNSIAQSLMLLPEITSESPTSRIRAYFDWEMAPLPHAPASPTNVVAIGTPNDLSVGWDYPFDDATGFAIERYAPNTERFYVVKTVSAAEHTTRITGYWTSEVVRVRAFNAGGMSEPSELVPVQPVPRKRVIRSR